MKVLLAHGDGQARRALAAALRREGFEVLLATCGAGAIQEWLASKPGLVVLELELPGLDGPTVCRRIRHQALIPVVLLGEDDSEDAIVWALECGADD
jgi:DNA-binding response OmpR family regulator